ncbi:MULTISPECIES: MBL fold metallo-hydrolase [Brevibacterium]|uniref:Glyoxylase, beta-lactamase superfamily II n=2 Tax=Brevibacterium antiquum TaxID=234835 RepID=A0A2H1L0U5_9MICO|nr:MULTISPECIES: MBL fold metallo-hydrolase [Brevibacterium]SMX97839.1 Glyoxylase, beta-lactamase superfamily II [Brevibacterium antiquum]SMY05082.1 Glyoxylase, beta-lactamase superfamily II [Brevibacterium antiquum CNRZ 918]HCG55470.1 MBL fold metallo-hydrolase [Brevibacterium sp.]
MVNVSVLSQNPAAVNCGIITGSHRSLIVDSGPGPNAADHLACRAQQLSLEVTGRDNPIDAAITHDHWDHFFGSATLSAAGIETFHVSESFARDQEATAWIALDAVRNAPETAEFASELPMDPNALIVKVSPIDGPESGTMLDLGNCRVEFHVLGGHSTADLVVRLVDQGIVFTGDLVEEGDPPQAGNDASLSEWVTSLQTLLSFPEATVFVPGHGVPVDRAFVERQLADIDGLRMNQADAEVALPARTMPGDHDRSFPREQLIGPADAAR